MKYVDEYRDGSTGARLAAAHRGARREPDRAYRFMEFCGGHTHAISRYGLEDLLPANIRMIHGPGCPVCVLPIGAHRHGDRAARERPDVTLCVYGDLMRVPGSNGIEPAQGQGGGRRHPHGLFDARRDRASPKPNPSREVVFFAIGFETTTPPTALAIRAAAEEGADEFLDLLQSRADAAGDPDDSGERRAMRELGRSRSTASSARRMSRTVIGTQPYRRLRRGIPEAGRRSPASSRSTSLQAILMLVRQINEGRAEVENQYIRAVTRDGNVKAQAEVADIFETARQLRMARPRRRAL